MKQGDSIEVTIKHVRLNKSERKSQGSTFGIYESDYVGDLKEFPNGIVTLNDYAKQNHEDWIKKTDKRAETLEHELLGKKIMIKITTIFTGEDSFDSEFVEIIQK